MLRTVLIAGVACVVGYIIGVRAGFDAAVRDHVENGSRLLQKIAEEKDKFEVSGSESTEEEETGEILNGAFQ